MSRSVTVLPGLLILIIIVYLMVTFHLEVMDEFRQTCPDAATSMAQKEILLLWLLSKVGLKELYNPAGEAIQVPLTSTFLSTMGGKYARSD